MYIVFLKLLIFVCLVEYRMSRNKINLSFISFLSITWLSISRQIYPDEVSYKLNVFVDRIISVSEMPMRMSKS